MTDGGQSKALLLAAAYRADTAHTAALRADTGLTELGVALNDAHQKIGQTQDGYLAALPQIREAIKIADGVLAGTASHQAATAISWLRQAEADLIDDLQKMQSEKLSIERLQGILNGIVTNNQQDRTLIRGAAERFRAHANTME